MTNRNQLNKGVENGNQEMVHNHPAKDRSIGLAPRGPKEAPHLPEREKARPVVHDAWGKPSLVSKFL
jgi:hypothetical protein